MSKRTDDGRRGFLLALGRGSLATCLGGGVAALLLREGGDCVDPGLCHGCPAFDGCDLPIAAAARRPTEEQPTVD